MRGGTLGMFGKKKEGAKPLRTAFKIKEKNKMDGGIGRKQKYDKINNIRSMDR